MLEIFLFPALNGPTIFHQDGAPPHWQLLVHHPNEKFPNSWVGRDGPILWPVRSPDLSPCDFFLWGLLKSRLYVSKPVDSASVCRKIEEEVRAISVDMLERASDSMERRMQCCIERGGLHVNVSV